jgi:hypothetical protein
MQIDGQLGEDSMDEVSTVLSIRSDIAGGVADMVENRHVVVSWHDQGQRLADQLRRKVTQNRLQSITGWNNESPIVLLFSPSPQVALCRWIPQTTAATFYARPAHVAESSDSTDEFVKSLNMITYFDAVSAIWGYPISSSHNILYRLSREASPEEQPRELRLTRDRSNDSDRGPTDFGLIRKITLQPNDRMAMNPFPLDLMVGLGKALSFRNSKDQDRFWKGQRFEEEVWFSVEGFGDWRKKDDLVDLVA